MNKLLTEKKVLIVGAGLAGSDAAHFLSQNGVRVVLAECKGIKRNPAQKVSTYGELVCTNSLKSKLEDSAHGILKHEMSTLGSLVLKSAYKHEVPAGGALAVDRDAFSAEITKELSNDPNIEIIESEVSDPLELMKAQSCDYVIVATGPLTTSPLEKWIQDFISKDDFYFYDAIAPVVDSDSLDMSKMYFKDRHVDIEDGVEPDYLNIPLNKEQYEVFIDELARAEKVPAQDFEEYKFFESCLPVDIMAERGPETARFSCMKPIGLELEDGTIPHACVQLRKENLLGSAYNLVGFQTRLTYKEQVRVFTMLPGFENASFIHLGSVHRNSFLNSSKLLNSDLSSKEFPVLSFAGQITGVEGYTESACMGLYVAFQILRNIEGKKSVSFPVETGIGALVNYIMTCNPPVPSNINFGLIPPVPLTKEQRKYRKGRKKLKKELAATRARDVFNSFYSELD